MKAPALPEQMLFHTESSDKEELPGTRAALTAEEQAYLNDYMESFPGRT